MQDLIGIDVVLQHDEAGVGTVIDVYDGTGMSWQFTSDPSAAFHPVLQADK